MNAHGTDAAYVRGQNAGGKYVGVALTAGNLEQVPEAEHLAPGIRLPQDTEECAERMDEAPCVSSSGTRPDESGRRTTFTGVPPELDPRTHVFRPVRPSSESVFSVAVQPGSPRSTVHDAMDTKHGHPGSVSGQTDSSGTGAFSNSSRATTPVHPTELSTSGAISRANSGTLSVAMSEAGSTISERSDLDVLDVRDAEQAIELQRMHERARSGGETGIGGAIPPPFACTPDQLDFMRANQSISTAATVASSPTTSGRTSPAPQSPSGADTP